MIKVYLFMFGIVVIVSVLWANIIDKTKDEDYDDTPFP
jgi:drug/metabolite transporter superfamily protein YnfA